MNRENKSEYKPSLLKAIIRAFGPWCAILGIFTFVEECVIRVFQPLFMGKLDQRILEHFRAYYSSLDD